MEIWLSVIARFALTAFFAAFCYISVGNAAIIGHNGATFDLVNSIFLIWALLVFATTLQRHGWITFFAGLMIVPTLNVLVPIPFAVADLALTAVADLVFLGLALQPMSVRVADGS
jgi:hypothetical protein